MQNWINQHQTVFGLLIFSFYFMALWCFVCALLSYIRGVDGIGEMIPVEFDIYRRSLEISKWPNAVVCQLSQLPHRGMQSAWLLPFGDAAISIQAAAIVDSVGRGHSHATSVSFYSLDTV